MQHVYPIGYEIISINQGAQQPQRTKTWDFIRLAFVLMLLHHVFEKFLFEVAECSFIFLIALKVYQGAIKKIGGFLEAYLSRNQTRVIDDKDKIIARLTATFLLLVLLNMLGQTSMLHFYLVGTALVIANLETKNKVESANLLEIIAPMLAVILVFFFKEQPILDFFLSFILFISIINEYSEYLSDGNQRYKNGDSEENGKKCNECFREKVSS